MPRSSKKEEAGDPETSLDLVFRALSDRTRRAILARVADEGLSVSELAEPFAMSMPAVSKHLSVLERAGLVERRAEGRVRRVELRAEGLSEASAWIEHYRRFWDDTLDALARYIESANGGTP